jgi:CPA2 family monovalent cation:H+ antiporter-2
MQRAPVQQGRSRLRGVVRVLLIDAVLLAIVIIGAAAEREKFAGALSNWLGLSLLAGLAVVITVALALAIPLLIGIYRNARRFGFILAVRALPNAGRRAVDFAAAPRRALVTMLQLATLLVIAVPVLAITQPFLPGYPGLALLFVLAVLLGAALWRSALNLQGHAQAGAGMIVAALAPHLMQDESDELTRTMEHVALMLPGLGDPEVVRIAVNSPAINKSLAELNIRGLTGATVLCITRNAAEAAAEDALQVGVPSGKQRLYVGDIIALAGSHESIRAARVLLVPPDPVWDRRTAETI